MAAVVYSARVLVLLPPSETKSDGGRGGPLELASLSFADTLTPIRSRLADALVDLAARPEQARTALGLGKDGTAEIARNAALRSARTRPALARYTGVLYDALDVASLTRAQKTKAADRLAIGSALFGVVRGGDAIPAYRLSAGSKLPGLGTLAALWKPALTPALTAAADGELVVDLRSGGYAALGRVPGAVTCTVVTEQPDGTRSIVSHFNKHHKGLLARALVVTRRRPRDVDALAAIASDAGQRVEIASESELVVVTQ